MGYMLVADSSLIMSKLALLPPGTRIKLSINDVHQMTSGTPINVMSVTSVYGTHYITSNFIIPTCVDNLSWEGIVTAFAPTNLFKVLGFIPPAYASRRLRIRRKLNRV
jgi:hypothetical protein